MSDLATLPVSTWARRCGREDSSAFSEVILSAITGGVVAEIESNAERIAATAWSVFCCWACRGPMSCVGLLSCVMLSSRSFCKATNAFTDGMEAFCTAVATAFRKTPSYTV